MPLMFLAVSHCCGDSCFPHCPLTPANMWWPPLQIQPMLTPDDMWRTPDILDTPNLDHLNSSQCCHQKIKAPTLGGHQNSDRHSLLNAQAHLPEQSNTHHNSGIWPLLLLTRFRTTYRLANTTLTKRKPPNFWSLLLANADTGWAKPATEPTQHPAPHHDWQQPHASLQFEATT